MNHNPLTHFLELAPDSAQSRHFLGYDSKGVLVWRDELKRDRERGGALFELALAVLAAAGLFGAGLVVGTALAMIL